MKFRLIHKLLIALFASAALVLLLILWVAKVNIGKGFEEFLARQERTLMPELVQELGSWYEERGSWLELQQNPRVFHHMITSIIVDRRRGDRSNPRNEMDFRPRHKPPPGKRLKKEKPGGKPGRPRHPRDDGAFHRRVFLLDSDYMPVLGHSSRQFPREDLIAVESAGEVVGWLGVESPHVMLAPAEQAFVKRIRNILWLGLGLGLGVAAILAWLLARHLGHPVSSAAGGIRKLAEGDYSTEVKTSGSDEIAQLGKDVNRLARALSENRNARQRWMADMAHELRTPLAIIQGELEAISDGVRPLDANSLNSIREEVLSLGKLVEDLNHLAMSDSGALAYQMTPLEFVKLIDMSVDAVVNRAEEMGITLTTSLPQESIWVRGDDQRLRQLIRIILDNAILYTDAPGEIEVKVQLEPDSVELIVNDSAPGVPAPECEQLFERLYRRESSRNRNTGGSGLGLAIARNIALAHDGHIEAQPGSLGGLQVKFSLPCQI